MKIISYNLNGIRAAAKLGVVEWLINEDADVVCLQEVRADEEICKKILEPFDNYYKVYNCGNRKGYSGTVMLLKERIGTVRIFDDFCCDDEGRIIIAAVKNYVFINAYVPNGATRFEYKKCFFQKLVELLRKFKRENRKVILGFDANVAHKEIDVNKPMSQGKKSGFLKEEREWLDELLASDFVDSFRELNKDAIQYTWRSYRARDKDNSFGWRFRFDYIICDATLRKRLKKCYSKDLEYSDHLPVILEIKSGTES